ncbi:thioredoxin [Nesterenkonia sp. HG001]|uniref:thioredoxin n=1 Tax=Nesterenkonia sp. HG001 TaxID=2983207 RepID=UPI003A101B53
MPRPFRGALKASATTTAERTAARRSRIVAAMATTDITAQDFQKTLEDNEILLVDFWADWCGPCKQFAPVYEKVSEEHPDVTFAKVDTEAEQELAAAASISSIPTLMAFREKVLVFSQPGALNADQLTEVITAVKGLDMEEIHRQIAEDEAEGQQA